MNKSTPQERAGQKFNFKKPAVYKIKVQGEISGSLTDRFGGLQITVDRSKGKDPVTVLIGQINDQSALSGVLTTLYDFHLPIISVSMLKENQ
jgi:hypothetical protein